METGSPSWAEVQYESAHSAGDLARSRAVGRRGDVSSAPAPGSHRTSPAEGVGQNVPPCLGQHDGVRDIEVRDDGIRLGQLLKLAGLVDAGSDVRPLLETGTVTVDGRLETRRGRQLKKGHVVAVGDEKVRLV